ncbi:DNA ligase D [Filimonas effusa]|uniref:DNA ligase (ATP) n=1 Tax=Filimonas effusa TaxID=2508721 RepID=A0A4Q1D4N2_9BACT|nr:DNA ligase D [Filimonas effusa]RXK83415.1 DNA ligase D [Filimonas effusa]
MTLTTYRKKRSFNQTPEPQGGKAGTKALHFVVQQHAASHLHYDFRLEMDGVLKSWAIPKGPSLNPQDKRLAMMVEDHPYDYRNFEGIIPKGNYGAGTVIVWDQGELEPLEPSGDKKKDEKALLQQLKAGSLKFSLHGTKLKGEFALVKLKNARENNAWLLIKHRDKYAKETDITKKNRSVISDKTLGQIAKTSDVIYEHGKLSKAKTNTTSKTTKKTAPPKKTAPKKTTSRNKKTVAAAKTTPGRKTTSRSAATPKAAVPKAATKATTPKTAAATTKPQQPLPVTGPKAAFPKTAKPMLAMLANKPFNAEGWLYEVKWDGYRALALSHKGKLELLSRNAKSFNDKFYPVYQAVKDWGIDAVVDGEICVLNEKGISHFGSLQNWRSEADGDLVYYVFDLLWLEGRNLMSLPLTQRRALLASRMPKDSIIRFSEAFESTATEFLEAATNLGMEGIMAKKADSEYIPGERTSSWIKIKAHKRHEVVIGGYTRNEDTPRPFSSLLVGIYDEEGHFVYTGKIGTGFNIAQQKEMLAQFNKLKRKTSPFEIVPDINKPSRFRPNPPEAKATWLKPQLVCEVSYTEVTTDGVMRHPSFEGMRTDKEAKKVVAEKAVAVSNLTKKEATKTEKMLKPVSKKGRKTLLNPTEETQVKTVNGNELSFTNLSKPYWPNDGYSKRDMLNYYYQVAPYILPYLVDRPQSLNRYPNGIKGGSFYQKDVTGKVPDWIQQFPYTTGEGEDKNFMVASNEASLLYMANLGVIEMNPWSSTIHYPDYPNWCLIDLDPSKSNTFDQVITVAQTVNEVLTEMKVKSYPKTSGSTGIHIYIPLGAQYTYDQSQLFAKMIAASVQQRLPEFTSIERMTRKRKGKLYIDYLQNRPQATLAAPYSLRPKPGATVSMPLHWEEVKKGLQLKDFNIQNAIARITSEGDIFRPVLGKGINLEKIINLK